MFSDDSIGSDEQRRGNGKSYHMSILVKTHTKAWILRNNKINWCVGFNLVLMPLSLNDWWAWQPLETSTLAYHYVPFQQRVSTTCVLLKKLAPPPLPSASFGVKSLERPVSFTTTLCVNERSLQMFKYLTLTLLVPYTPQGILHLWNRYLPSGKFPFSQPTLSPPPSFSLHLSLSLFLSLTVSS